MPVYAKWIIDTFEESVEFSLICWSMFIVLPWYLLLSLNTLRGQHESCHDLTCGNSWRHQSHRHSLDNMLWRQAVENLQAAPTEQSTLCPGGEVSSLHAVVGHTKLVQVRLTSTFFCGWVLSNGYHTVAVHYGTRWVFLARNRAWFLIFKWPNNDFDWPRWLFKSEFEQMRVEFGF